MNNNGNYGGRRQPPISYPADSYTLFMERQRKTDELKSRSKGKGKAVVFLSVFILLLVAAAEGFICYQAVGAADGADRLSDARSKGFAEYLSALNGVGLDRMYAERYEIKKEIIIEASREKLTVSSEDFTASSAVTLEGEKLTFIPDTVGVTNVTLLCPGRRLPAVIRVEDTIPPSALPAEDVEIWKGEQLDAEMLVTDIEDATGAVCEITDVPDAESDGVYDYTVTLTDSAGNSTRLVCPVFVHIDDRPPQIFGAEDRMVYIGSTIAYKEGIVVRDNHDEQPELTVDISGVDPTAAGKYEVIYTASDSAGNTTEKKVTFTFVENGTEGYDEELKKLTTEVLSSIITEDMTQREQAWEIYQWIRKHISYISWVDKSDWKKAAVEGLKKHHGSCYTYYAVSRALLTEAGIPNLPVRKKPMEGRSDHYWNLVNCGDGWYHFDTVKRGDGTVFFMWTDAQIRSYSNRHHNSHDFDPEVTPATPLE